MLKRQIYFGIFCILLFPKFTQAQTAEVVIKEMAFCSVIENREPVDPDTVFSLMEETIYCFIRVYAAETPNMVLHIWYYNDVEVSRVELEIKSQTWRTWSSKRIFEDQAGKWRVDVVSWEGLVLKSREFTVGTVDEMEENAEYFTDAPAEAEKPGDAEQNLKNETQPSLPGKEVPVKEIPVKEIPVNATLKPAEITDVDILLQFTEASYRENKRNFNKRNVLKTFQMIILNKTYGQVWIIRNGENSIGYVLLALSFSLEHDGVMAILDEFYVDKTYRGKSVEAQVIRLAEEAARSREARALYVKAAAENPASQTLYHPLGYDENGRYFLSKPLENK